ncbi:MAG: VIT1/CCC1 transporter family protein [Candidatus Bathyarchaeia archaeon]
MASFPSLLPFILTIFTLIPINLAFSVSIIVDLIALFLLGAFLGRISERNAIHSGLKMMLAGVVVAILALLINRGLEA